MPLWAVPYNLVNSYASLYMLEQGVSATQVGAVNSISFIAKTIFALFAGYIVNRFGRRKSAAVLDFIGWAFPMLIYFFATTYWQFLLAAVINCLTVINGIISQCFFTEDVEEKSRLKSFNFNAIATSVCGFFVPLTGLFISRFGFLPAIRGLYLFAFFSMAAMAVCKFFLLRETSVGKAMMERREPLRNPVSILMKPLRYVVGNRRLVFLFSVNIDVYKRQTIYPAWQRMKYGSKREASCSFIRFRLTIALFSVCICVFLPWVSIYKMDFVYILYTCLLYTSRCV